VEGHTLYNSHIISQPKCEEKIILQPQGNIIIIIVTSLKILGVILTCGGIAH